MTKYAPKFTMLSKYTPFMVANPRARMSKFISKVLDLVSKECKTAMLVKEMDISQLMFYAEKIKYEKLRERTRESKRAWIEGGVFSHQRIKSG